MAERRMFAKSIVNSGKFLQMPPSSRLLYYDLGMNADDDGVVEAFSVMRQTQAVEDDLKVLVSKGFVEILNENLVSLIIDWNTNNFIRNDRYHPSVHKALLVKFFDQHADDPDLSERWYTEVRKVKSKDSLVQFRINQDVFADFAGSNEKLLETLRDFEKMRDSINKPMGDKAKKILVNKLKEFPKEEQVPILEQSIEHCWLSIYPLKSDDKSESGKGKEGPAASYDKSKFEASGKGLKYTPKGDQSDGED